MSNLIYDSLFSDRLVMGEKDYNGTKVINLSDANSLSSKLWKKVPILTAGKVVYQDAKSPNYGLFFIAKTFNQTDSSILLNNISTNGKVFFDDNGNIDILSSDGDHLLQSTVNGKTYNYFKNPLTTVEIGFSKPSIFSDVEGKFAPLLREDFILSKNKKWILYKENNIFYLLYNPIHRKSFKNFYNSQTLTSGTNALMKEIFDQYCELNSTADGNPVRKYVDKSCNCIQIQDRIDDAIGGAYVSNTKYRNSLINNAMCNAPNCKSNLANLNIPDSFMSTTDGNGFYDKLEKSIGGTCPPPKTVLCTTELKASGGINVANSNVAQICGNDYVDTSLQSSTTPAPPATSPTPTTPDPYANLLGTETNQQQTAPTTTKKSTTDSTGLIIGGIGGAVFIVLLFGVFIYIKLKKNQTR